MQTNEVKAEFPRVGRMIDAASQLCQITGNVPEELRTCLSELERASDQAKRILAESESEERIAGCISQLESLADRAMQLCKQAGGVDADIQQAVQRAHDALSGLKNRLH